MCVHLDPLAFTLHFASQLCIASKLVCSLLEAMAGSLSVAITAVLSAKVADVVSGEIGETASTTNIEILERFQSKVLRMITDAPRYVPNTVIQKNLQIPTVKHKISRYSYNYSKRLSVHPNELILNLQEPPETGRLRKDLPMDLPTRFNI
jgi:hypothetical protein